MAAPRSLLSGHPRGSDLALLRALDVQEPVLAEEAHGFVGPGEGVAHPDAGVAPDVGGQRPRDVRLGHLDGHRVDVDAVDQGGGSLRPLGVARPLQA